ncbi:nucleotide-diphospho-sugar transferase [Xylariaceae sp. FL0255]|nr:nucleotide-diphospho-sugar transferase [Xylariaceae sp. FL0255]
MLQQRIVLFRRQRFVYITAIALFFLVFGRNFLYNLGDWIRQTNPWSYQWEVQQAFVATQDELDCVSGTTRPIDPTVKIDPIPNHIHFIYGLGNPFYKPSAGEFDFLAYLAVRSAIVGVKADNIFLHYTYLAHPPHPEPNTNPYSNPWVERLKNDITLVYHSPEEIDSLKHTAGANWQAAHISDVLRLKILSEQGGIYFDIDAFGLRPFTNILKSPRDMVMGHEGGDRAGLCNAIMAARANSTFIKRWLKEYEHADLTKEWNYHSVILPKELQLQKSDDICALPPSSLFWPTWTWNHVDWMHESLRPSEARHWAAELDRNRGSLFVNQFAYHGWSQMAWHRYLKHLTPETVRNHDTRFNLMVRRFLQDDLGVTTN